MYQHTVFSIIIGFCILLLQLYFKVPNFKRRWFSSTFRNQMQVNPSDVIILDGILILHDPRVREIMNMKIFVDSGSSLLALNIPRLSPNRKEKQDSCLLDILWFTLYPYSCFWNWKSNSLIWNPFRTYFQSSILLPKLLINPWTQTLMCGWPGGYDEILLRGTETSNTC